MASYRQALGYSKDSMVHLLMAVARENPELATLLETIDSDRVKFSVVASIYPDDSDETANVSRPDP